jgi:hypothetical protein
MQKTSHCLRRARTPRLMSASDASGPGASVGAGLGFGSVKNFFVVTKQILLKHVLTCGCFLSYSSTRE